MAEEAGYFKRPSAVADERLDSPFLAEDLFLAENDKQWEHLTAFELESPFRHAFEHGRTHNAELEKLGDELVEKNESLQIGFPTNDGSPQQEGIEEFCEEEAPSSDGESLSDHVTPEEISQHGDEIGIEREDHETIYRSHEAERERGAGRQLKVFFPSGEWLPVLTGLPEGRDEEYWDPTGSGNPTLDTGPAHKDKKLSANFTVRDLTTSGGVSADVARIDPKLVESLQQLRDHLGKNVIKITSGYRSWKRNKEVYARRKNADGSPKKPTLSQHCGGRAADITARGMNGLEIGKAAIDACGPNLGIGLGNTFAHVDIRGIPVAWNYGGVKSAWVEEIKRYQHAKRGIRPPSAGADTAKPSIRGSAKQPAERVRFAQRVLNAAQGERLAVDGGLGPLTHAALERFRKRHRLGPGGVLDERTELALLQRALEELAQQSLFEPGVRDAKTDQALKTFKSERGLGSNATLDAATRAALGAALKSRPPPVGVPKLQPETTMVDEDRLIEPEDEFEPEAGDYEAENGVEVRELDPSVLDIAEKTIAREAPLFEEQLSTRWTRCFSATDVARVEKVYQDNASAAGANSVDRCSCIVMLNVALGQLLSLPVRRNRARGASTRIVQMGNLTTESIEKAIAQLLGMGYASAPTVMNFFDHRNRTAGTLKPERLKASVQAKVLALSETKGCWFAFGLSIMDGYHSVLLLVDRTAADAKIYWLDQFSGGVTDDVTGNLDQRITDKTQTWWQAVMRTKGKGYKTTIRLWPLRKRRKQP